jgi:serine/threonine protein kinase
VTTTTLRAGDIVLGERGRAYHVGEWRGEGSYARVFRVIADATAYALKLAKPEIAGAAERLERERGVRARIHHPRLVGCLDAGQWQETPFLVLAWVEGPDLRRLVERQRRLPLVIALGYLQDISGAVAALHAGGLAHGDLRPENVLVEELRRHAILADLGEAVDRRDPDHSARLRGDLCALGDLLAFTLTGEHADAFPPRLTAAQGYNPAAVRLEQEAFAGRLTATAFHKQVTQLLKAIGAARRP